MWRTVKQILALWTSVQLGAAYFVIGDECTNGATQTIGTDS